MAVIRLLAASICLIPALVLAGPKKVVKSAKRSASSKAATKVAPKTEMKIALKAAPKKRAPAAVVKKGPQSDWAYVEKRLLKEGLKKDFIKSLKETFEDKRFLETLELNTLLYLKKTDYHGPQVTHLAAGEVRKFISKNKTALNVADTKYGVPPDLIASLLWLETRHGQNKGTFHTPSVFASLTQADRPSIVQHLVKAAEKYGPVSVQVAADIESRAKRKASWAVGELIAIEKIYRSDKKVLRGWKGSFAGAFGMPQFIPSSYVAYARALKKGAIANINTPSDAIISVANYLDKNGWRKHHPRTHEKALFRYNNSHDYTAAVLSIAKKSRMPTSVAAKSRPKKS